MRLTIEESVKDCLRHVADKAINDEKTGFRYNQYWTENIILALANEGKRRRYEVMTNVGLDGDWGVDLAWIELKNGVMSSSPLLMMCDWRPSPYPEIRLRTLIGARTHLRVIIIDATFAEEESGYARQWALGQINSLKEQASVYDASELSDKYLFCVWCRDKDVHEWHFDECDLSPPEPSPLAE